MSDRILQVTADGSHTISIPALNVSYHSRYGAIQESRHVFIEAGLQCFLDFANIPPEEAVKIFEVGFGTGLNALLSLIEAVRMPRKIYYNAVEPFPLSIDEVEKLNYVSLLSKNLSREFMRMHEGPPDNEIAIHPYFSFKKSNIIELETEEKFHVIYFDAFDPNVQPGLWTQHIFRKMFNMLEPNGLLTTYSSKGAVRRALQAAGFKVEKLPGPAGKREMIRARK
ncbi:MAG TPA: tRNA (5-methylaminomethyl-2-thiouridine)(34)-methyltransferase MnmD [Parafilimonas sp.]|nr:tRNA (5-methylaminomethyl-2-thiouridine)(34)-methyltransferase MnmD [Parafilimonas sp.]